MGLRSPQDLKTVAIQPTNTFRFNAVKPVQLDGSFLDTASKVVTAQEAARQKLQKKKEDLIKARADNESEADVIGAQAELTDARGHDALEVGPKKTRELEETFRERLDAADPVHRPALEQIYAKKLNKFKKMAVPYVYGESRKVEDAEFTTQVANATNDAAEFSADPEYFSKEGLRKVTEAVQAQGNAQGLKPEQIEYNANKQVSYTVLSAIHLQSKLDVNRAKEILARHDVELFPEDRTKAETIIKAAEEDSGTRRALWLADQARQRGGENLTAQTKFITEFGEGDSVTRQALSFLSTRTIMDDKQKKRDIEDLTAKALAEADKKGGDPSKYLLQIPSGKARAEATDLLEKRAKGNGGLTNWSKYEELRNVFNTDRERARSINLKAWQPHFGADVYGTFEAWQDRLKKEKTDEISRTQLGGDEEISQITNEFLNRKKIFLPNERAEAHYQARLRYEQLLVENKNADRRKIRSTIMNELEDRGTKTSKTGGWFGTGFMSKEKNVVNDKFATSARPKESTFQKYRAAAPKTWSDQKVLEYIEYQRANNKLQE